MDVRLSEVIGALSHALDVTEGQPRGHAERTCLIGMRLADMLDLASAERSSLFGGRRGDSPRRAGPVPGADMEV